jgi:hypothetical protein
VVASKIAGDRVPIEQLRVEWSVVATVERISEHLLGADVRRGASFLETGVRFAEGEDVEEIKGRDSVDGAVMLVAAVVTDDYRRQPNDIQLPDMRIAEIDP